MKNSFKLALVATAAALSFGATAQDFPAANRSVTIVVPFAAGGPTDRV
ncbi:MAG: tripartite tricarboxylate transporter substrate binding protein BugD, partial [Burkholderiaceae bacterium]